jgi:hypothetical protein
MKSQLINLRKNENEFRRKIKKGYCPAGSGQESQAGRIRLVALGKRLCSVCRTSNNLNNDKMKKKELLKRIEALEKQFDILSDEVMDLEVEKQMQPCPTAEKFKAIADHANSINDVIQNAPKDDTIYVPDGILNVNMEIINGKRHCSIIMNYGTGNIIS